MGEALKFCKYCFRQRSPDSFSVRKASPDGLAYKCRDCDKAYRAERGKTVYAELKAKWHQRNAETERAKALLAYHSNRELKLAQHREYMRKTAEQQKKYRQENSADYVARTAKRRQALRKRVPTWVTEAELSEIRKLYREAARLTRLTGISFHVDHIIPIQGRKVSGLHVLSNLQILNYFENVSKGCKYEV